MNARMRIVMVAATLASLAAAVPARAGEPVAASAQDVEAADHFRRGAEFYKQGDHKLALIEFDRAYQLAPSYRVLYNIGQVNFQLGNYARALRAFRRYLQEGGEEVPPERRSLVEADVAALVERVASVRIKSNVDGADVMIDDVPVGRTPFEDAVLLDAGQHVVRVASPGHEPQQRALTLAGRDRIDLEVLLKKTESLVVVRTEQRPTSVAPVIAWVATGALATTALVTGLLSLNSQSSLRTLRDSSGYVSASELDGVATRAETYALVSDIALAGTILAAGAAVYLTFIRADPPPAPQGASARFVGSGLVGTF